MSFTLKGEDGHSAALVELYALILEKEGRNAEEVKSLRDDAARLAEHARQANQIVLTLDALLMMAASMREEAAQPIAEDPAATADSGPEQQSAPEQQPRRRAWNAPFEVGEIVCAGISGAPAKLVRILTDNKELPENIRDAIQGKVNIMLPRAPGVVTVESASLRRATPQETQAYYDAGGR